MTTTTPARDLSGLKGVDIDRVYKGKRRPRGKADACTLGGRIQHARIDNGMTQAELAETSNLTRYVIIAIENGKSHVSLGAAVALARALDVSLDYLAGLSPEFGKFPLEAE